MIDHNPNNYPQAPISPVSSTSSTHSPSYSGNYHNHNHQQSRNSSSSSPPPLPQQTKSISHYYNNSNNYSADWVQQQKQRSADNQHFIGYSTNHSVARPTAATDNRSPLHNSKHHNRSYSLPYQHNHSSSQVRRSSASSSSSSSSPSIHRRTSSADNHNTAATTDTTTAVILENNRYKCNQCLKTFSRPSSLRIHILSHTGEKPHVCPRPGCGRRFSVQSNMRRHLKVHYCNPTPITITGTANNNSQQHQQYNIR